MTQSSKNQKDFKSLFRNVGFRYTEEAKELNEKTYTVLKGLFKDFLNRGFSPREICYVMSKTVEDIEIDEIISLTYRKDEGDE